MKTWTSALLVTAIIASVAAGISVPANEGSKTGSVDVKRSVVTAAPVSDTRATSAPAVPPPVLAKTAVFEPPSEQDIPKDGFGDAVRKGKDIFDHPERYASQYVGNSLHCSSCHLDSGRLANSSPMWAAYVSYPAYRSKNKHVNTFAERLQGCFRYSMNGKAPALGDPVLVSLESYAYWLASGALIDPKITGRGYPAVGKPPLPRDYARGRTVFQQNCALCHGADGAGQADANGQIAFPPLWGQMSFNWGAGMGSIKNAAGFIKANMPLGLGGTLSDQQAWDVATFMDSQERPQDPRFKGSVAATRAEYHDSSDDMYGLTVEGHVLGNGISPPTKRQRPAAR